MKVLTDGLYFQGVTMFQVLPNGPNRIDIEFGGKLDSEIEGTLIPGLEIKAFDLDEADEAERWLAG